VTTEFFVDCCRTGYCCGYRRDSYFGGVSYQQGEIIPDGVEVYEKEGEWFIPVDEEDTCIYLEKLNNGFTSCRIHDKRPKTCKFYNCLTEKKIVQLQPIIEHLKGKCE